MLNSHPLPAPPPSSFADPAFALFQLLCSGFASPFLPSSPKNFADSTYSLEVEVDGISHILPFYSGPHSDSLVRPVSNISIAGQAFVSQFPEETAPPLQALISEMSRMATLQSDHFCHESAEESHYLPFGYQSRLENDYFRVPAKNEEEVRMEEK